jgi:hypothetical protein
MQPLRMALLGAAGSGKTQLAGELKTALAALGQPKVLIADNPPLDDALPQPFDLILLMGLDTKPAAALVSQREAADVALRQDLARRGWAYQVIYGLGAMRLENALLAINAALPGQRPEDQTHTQRQPWVWACDNCSDPLCERRWLSDLLASRADTPS